MAQHIKVKKISGGGGEWADPEPDRGEVMEPGASPEPVAGGEDDEQPWEGGCQRRISPEELPGQAEGRRGMRGARERVGRDWGEKMEGVHTRR
uniref:Uncharacterized protein n=1 Tax=Oryza sativa subsp. japonica TaxID=39947 RepID=Q8LHP1_ORYSJ|nr:hypothetical protein [Oryza sativa Japonica Group]